MSLKASLNLNAVQLRRELSAWAALRNSKPVRLIDFLRDTGLELADIYSARRSCTSYKRDIKLPMPSAGPRAEELSKGVRSVLHVNDSALQTAWSTALSTGQVDPRDEYRIQMLAYQRLNNNRELVCLTAFIQMMAEHLALRDEILEIFGLLKEQSSIPCESLRDASEHWPIALHARYQRREIQTLEISVIWRLKREMPAGIFRKLSAIRG